MFHSRSITILKFRSNDILTFSCFDENILKISIKNSNSVELKSLAVLDLEELPFDDNTKNENGTTSFKIFNFSVRYLFF